MKKSIFSIVIGSNDFINNYLLQVLAIGANVSQTLDSFVDHHLSHLQAHKLHSPITHTRIVFYWKALVIDW